MDQSMILTNARIVTRDEELVGTVTVVDGLIDSVETGGSSAPGAIDLDGDFLLPGLVEMHTDNVEKHMMPRPGVIWPSASAAIMAHDVQMVGAGVTTVYDAISVGEYLDRAYRRDLLARAVEAVRLGRSQKMFKAEHYLHLRCEVSDDAVVSMFEPYADDPIVKLISVMDHTPGQRQWRDMKSFRQFNQQKYKNDEEFDAYIKARLEKSSAETPGNRRRILELWSQRGLPAASHDDTTLDHVDEAIAEGIRISEFPTTMEAARKAKEDGMVTVAGAPNVVRGGSHSGNVSAIDLAREGYLDALSSDYAPVSLLHAAFILHETLKIPLPDTIAMVSANTADMLELHDRGSIAVGRRADMVRARRFEDSIAVRQVWRQGERVL